MVLQEHDVPTAQLWFCGGHGTCLTDPGDPKRVATASFAWLDHYVKGEDTELPKALSLIDQDGKQWTADFWPVEEGSPFTDTGSGTLRLQADGGSGGGDVSSLDLDPNDPLAGLTASITPTKAQNAVNVPIDTRDADVLALGAPIVSFTYTAEWTGDVAGTEGRVFAQLVDDETGLVVGNQITPVKIVVDGKVHSADAHLEVIAHHVTPGHGLTLQLVAATTAYGIPTKPGTVDFRSIEVTVPTAEEQALDQG